MNIQRSLSPMMMAAALLSGLAAGRAAPLAAPMTRQALALPAAARSAPRLGALAPADKVQICFSLPLRDQAGLDSLIMRLNDPLDPEYKRFLTPAQFAARFGPTAADYDAVAAYAKSQGLTVTQTFTARTLLSAEGTAAQVSQAFGVGLNRFARPNGSAFYAADSGPLLPTALSAKGIGIVGLDNFAQMTPQHREVPVPIPLMQTRGYTDSYPGSGPNGGISPGDITNYTGNGDFGVGSYQGQGQSMALYEFDGYNVADIQKYATEFHKIHTGLVTISIDGASYPPSGSAGQGEVTLDIDMALIFAPLLQTIYVYEAPNSSTGKLDMDARIANDNAASTVSISWGGNEYYVSSYVYNAENALFAQMAAQGQSVFAAAGDTGAFEDLGGHTKGPHLAVLDPASQPWVTGVGGTQINSHWNFFTGWHFDDEAAWGNGGGGISSIWSLPAYQSGLAGIADGQVSLTRRNVPDVSANAGTPYAVYKDGGWKLYTGTSAAAPLWAGYIARINSYAAANGQPVAGNINALLYPNNSGSFLFDPTSGDNGHFYTYSGYDNATGLGVMRGGFIFSSGTATQTVAAAPASSVYGQPVTLTATVNPYAPVSPVTGSVTFYDGAAVLGAVALSGGTTSLTLNTLPVGGHDIGMEYSGDAHYFGSAGNGGYLTVSQGSAAQTLAATPVAPTVGRSFNLKATVTPVSPSTLTPTGSVNFFSTTSHTFLGTAPLVGGVATFSVTEPATGSYGFSCLSDLGTGYAGATTFATVPVGLNSTTTALTASPAQAPAGKSVTLRASVTTAGPAPTGNVVFSDGGVTLATVPLSGVAAQYAATFATLGSHSLKASYAGDSASAPSVGTTGETVDAPVLTGLTFPSPVVGGTVVTATVALSAVTPTDIVVGLSSSDSSIVRVFRSVIIPAGSSSGTFPINTFRSHFNQSVTIRASLGTTTLTTPLPITGR